LIVVAAGVVGFAVLHEPEAAVEAV